MANRYWVGGSGTWDGTNTTNWSATSGGTGGASVPTISDDVFLDANSTGTVTTSGGINAKSLDCTGFTGTFAGSGSLSLYGNLTYGSAMTLSWTGNANVYDNCTVKTNGIYKPAGTVTFFNAGFTFQLADAYSSGGTLSHRGGDFRTNNYSIIVSQLTMGGANAKTVDFGTSTITITGQQLQIAGSGYTSFLATNSTINFTGSNAVVLFAGNNFSYGTVVIGNNTSTNIFRFGVTSASMVTLTSTRTVAYTLQFGANLTYTFNNFNITGSAGALVTVSSHNLISQTTLVKPGPWNVGANSINNGNNTGLSFTGSNPDYLAISYVNGVSTAPINTNTNFLSMF